MPQLLDPCHVIVLFLHLLKTSENLWGIGKDQCFQLTFTCSKSTIETLEKGVKYVQN